MSKAITREHFGFVLVDFIDDPYNPRCTMVKTNITVLS